MKLKNNNTRRPDLLTLVAKRMRILTRIPLLPILFDEQIKLFTFIVYPKRFLKMQELSDFARNKLKLQTGYHRLGGIAFLFERKEIAHLHGNGLLDIKFPRQLSRTLIETGFTQQHHVFPHSGWTSFPIKGNSDIEGCEQMLSWALSIRKKELTTNDILGYLKNTPYVTAS